MHTALRGLVGITCWVYVDDILVATNKEQHLQAVEDVLKRLIQHGMTLSPKKLQVCLTHVEYLGHKVGGGVITLAEKHTRTIFDYPIPNYKKELGRFMGLTRWFRKFIKSYSDVELPLRQVEATKPFRWNEEAQLAFTRLKEAMSSKPILKMLDPAQPLIVYTDASKDGFGCVVAQVDAVDGEEYVVIYASRSTSSAEANWSITELECGAVVWALLKFRVLLIGKLFTLYTDHQALEWMVNSVKEPPARSKLVRWLLLLSEYNMILKYRPGNEMPHVDALSRVVLVNDEVKRDLMSKLQAEDDQLMNKWRLLHDKDPQQWALKHGIKGKYVKSKWGYRYWVPWIPSSERNKFLQAVHDSLLGGGHFGVSKTLLKLRHIAWWPEMRGSVREWIKSCEICCKSKLGVQPEVPHKELGFRPAGHTVHIDYAVDLPETERGYKHGLVMVDKGTGMMVVAPVRTRDSKEAVAALLNHWIAVWGVMSVLASDNEKSFASKEFLSGLSLVGAIKVQCAPHHPAGNGQAETRMKPLLAMIRAFCHETNTWDQYLPVFSWCYNISPRADGKPSPFYLMLGREPSLPIQLDYQDTQQLQGEVVAFDATYKRVLKMLAESKDVICRPTSYKAGDCVMVRNFTRADKNKLRRHWEGPVEVRRVEGQVIELVDGRRLHEVSVKPCPAKLRPACQQSAQELFPTNQFTEVRKIVGKRVLDNQEEYKVRWFGTTKLEDSWLGVKDLKCPELIKKFEEGESGKLVRSCIKPVSFDTTTASRTRVVKQKERLNLCVIPHTR
jgi:hypothetical protein